MNKADKENIIRLKKQGYSYQAIGALYNLSRQRIHQLISGYYKNNASLKHQNGWYRGIRDSIFKRDNEKCQKCGTRKQLVVHHIDGDDNNNKFSNLITLCNKCHLTLHRPDGWEIRRNGGNKDIPTFPLKNRPDGLFRRFRDGLLTWWRKGIDVWTSHNRQGLRGLVARIFKR